MTSSADGSGAGAMDGKDDARNALTPMARAAPLLGVVIAIGVQLLATVHVGATPVRIALSDVLLPVAAVIATAIFIAARLRRPRWVAPHLDLMLVGFLFLLGVSCLIGWQRSGAFIAWAWGPKFVGFGVLIAYLVVGALVAEAGEWARERAFFAFVATSWAIAASALVRFFVEINGALPFGEMAFRPVGFSDNPNAFAFLLGTALIVQLLAGPSLSGAPRALSAVGLAAMIAALFLTGSRSAYLGLLVAAPVVIFFRARLDWRPLIAGAALAPIMVLVSIQNFDLFVAASGSGAVDSALHATREAIAADPLAYATRHAIVVDGGVSERLSTTRMALALWREAPLFGVGVGGFMHQYAQTTGGGLFALHTSALWLLVETGIVGLVYFAAIFVALFWGVQKRARHDGDGPSAAVCGLLLFAAGASVGTEIIYQRQLWFLIGLVAAYPGAWSAVMRGPPATSAST